MTDRRRSSTASNDSASTTDSKSPAKSVVSADLLKSRAFRIPSHSDSILQMLNKQRNEGEFCDITVLVEHQRFSAHKCVLAANSLYFKSLLSTDNDGVFLRHITADSFKAILDFMYTSRLNLESTTVQDVLSAAKFLQVKGVVSICCRYLESQIRNLARDLDEQKKKSNKPAVISIDADIFKDRDAMQAFSPLQQQPQIAYNPDTGAFESEYNLPPTLGAPTQMNDSTTQQFLFPFQTNKLPVVPSNQHHMPTQTSGLPFNANQNSFANTIPHSMTLRTRNFNPNLQNNFLPQANNTKSFLNPNTQPNFQQTAQQNYPWSNPNYSPSFVPFETKRNSLSPDGHNSYNFAGSRNQMSVPSHPRLNQVNHMYTSQSTGGKGRKLHPQARRKGTHGTVSDTQSLKFSFGNSKLSPRKVPSTTKPFTFYNDTNSEVSNEPDVFLLSSARGVKPSLLDKQSKPESPSETIFDIEAEDRYWDALSTRTQDGRH